MRYHTAVNNVQVRTEHDAMQVSILLAALLFIFSIATAVDIPVLLLHHDKERWSVAHVYYMQDGCYYLIPRRCCVFLVFCLFVFSEAAVSPGTEKMNVVS